MDEADVDKEVLRKGLDDHSAVLGNIQFSDETFLVRTLTAGQKKPASSQGLHQTCQTIREKESSGYWC